MNKNLNNIALQTTLIVLLALIVLLPTLGFYPLLPPDEARYVEIPREMVESGDYIVPRLNGVIYLEKPPLFYWLQTIPIKLFGIHEGALRFWNAFFAALMCGLVFLTARNLYDFKMALLASGMLFSSLLFFALAHFMSLDMAFSTFISGCLFGILIGFNTEKGFKRRCWFYMAYVSAALAVLTKGFLGFLVPGAIIFLWLLLTNNWRELKYAYIPTGVLLFLAITLPWHVLVQQRVPEFFDFYVIGQHFARYFTEAEERYQPIWYFMPVLLLGVLPWLPWVLKAICKQSKQLKPNELFLMIWAIFIFIFFSLSKSKLIPYILPVLPPLFLLTAKQLVADKSKLCGKWGLAIGLITVLIFSVSVPLWSNSRDRSLKPLVEIIKPLNYDEVVAFSRYYQDLPVYLGHTVTLVGSLNELRLGTELEDHSEQYPDFGEFWDRWHAPSHRMIVFLSQNKYDNFLRDSKLRPQVLGETSRVIVVSNFNE